MWVYSAPPVVSVREASYKSYHPISELISLKCTSWRLFGCFSPKQVLPHSRFASFFPDDWDSPTCKDMSKPKPGVGPDCTPSFERRPLPSLRPVAPLTIHLLRIHYELSETKPYEQDHPSQAPAVLLRPSHFPLLLNLSYIPLQYPSPEKSLIVSSSWCCLVAECLSWSLATVPLSPAVVSPMPLEENQTLPSPAFEIHWRQIWSKSVTKMGPLILHLNPHPSI